MKKMQGPNSKIRPARKEWYQALLNCLHKQQYPTGYTKHEKFILRRASNSFQVIGDQLHYIDRISVGSLLKTQVIRSRKSVFGVPFNYRWA